MNPVIAWIIAFFGNQTVRAFLTQYAAKKALDYGVSKVKDTINKKMDSVEKELVSALNDSLQNTCKYFGWEYDPSAVFETFTAAYQEKWTTPGGFISEEDYEQILSKAIGQSVDKDVFKYWCYAVNNSITDEKYQHLYRFVTIIKLDFLGEKLKFMEDILKDNRELLPAKPRMTDGGIQTRNAFDRLFPEIDEPEKRENSEVIIPYYGSSEWMETLSPEERIQFEDAMQYLYFLGYGVYPDFSSPENFSFSETARHEFVSTDNENSTAAEENSGGSFHMAAEKTPVDFEEGADYGKYFSIYDPKGYHTVIYMISRVALPELHKWMYYPERLDMAALYNNIPGEEPEIYVPGSVKKTFFIDHPNPEGNHLAIFTFVKNDYVIINTGFLDDDRMSISKKPTFLKIKNDINETINIFCDHTIDDFGWEINHNSAKEIELEYTIYPDRRIVLMDVETGEEIKPYFEYRSDKKAKIKLAVGKKYFAFQIGSAYKTDYSLTDYDIGYFYKYGKYRLNITERRVLPQISVFCL